MPNAHWYAFMTEAQSEVYPELFSRFPHLGYGPPILLTSADGGKTFTFGTDADGDPIRPVGHAEIYPNLNSIPNSPLSPGDDFMIEGSLIRMPNNRSRSFNGGPYARLVLSPDTEVSAVQEPQLFPKHARMLLVYKALEQWASRPGSGALPDYYKIKYGEFFNKLMLEFATAYNKGGRVGSESSGLLYVGDFGQSGLNT